MITSNSIFADGVYINVIPEGISGKSKRAQKAIKSSINATPLKDKTMSVISQRDANNERIGNDFAVKIVNDYNSPESAYKINMITGWPGSAKTSNVNKYGIKALVKNGVRLFVMAVPQTSISQQTYQSLSKIVSNTGVVSQACQDLKIGCSALTGEEFKQKTNSPQGGMLAEQVIVVVASVQFVHKNLNLFTSGHFSPAGNGAKAVMLIDEAHIGVGNSTPENSMTNKGVGYGDGKWADSLKQILDSAPDLWRLYAMTASPTPSQQNYSTVDKMTPREFIDMSKEYRSQKDYTAYKFIFINEHDVKTPGTKMSENAVKKKMSEMVYERSLEVLKQREIDQSKFFSLISPIGKKWLIDNGNPATEDMPNHLDGYCAPQCLSVIGALGPNGRLPSGSISYTEAKTLFRNDANSKNFDFSVTYTENLYVEKASGDRITFKTPYPVYEHMRDNYSVPRIHHSNGMGLVGLNVPSIRVISWTRHPSQDVDSGPLINGMGRASRLICGKFMDSEEFIKALWNDPVLHEADKQAIHDYFLCMNVSVYVMPKCRLTAGDKELRDSECNTEPYPSETVRTEMEAISFSKEEFYKKADEWKEESVQKLHTDRLHITSYLARTKLTKGMLCEYCAPAIFHGETMPGCLANHINTEGGDIESALESYNHQKLLNTYVKSVLSTHHKDVDPSNNDEVNLMTVCHNAHMTITIRESHNSMRKTEERDNAVFASRITTLNNINKIAKKVKIS
jgi:hypothetical protein